MDSRIAAENCPLVDVDTPLTWVQSLVGVLILLIAGLYVSITLLYVSPNNAVRIHFDKELSAFESWAYQKWTFFAPPPMHNDRLYFAYSPKTGDGKTVEVLKGIYSRKQQDSPINTRAQVIDYVISGTARQVADMIREIYRYEKVNALIGADPAILEDLAMSTLDPKEEEYGAYIRLLMRYAALVAAEQGIELDGLKCQIALTEEPLRPFSQRFNADFEIQETLVYRTAVLDLPRLQD